MLEEFQRDNEICEEVFNYKITARPNRRRQFEKELTSAIEIALNILSACLNIIELKEQVGALLLNDLEAFASWLRLRHRQWHGSKFHGYSPAVVTGKPIVYNHHFGEDD
ncbi:Transportin MOS14 [Camellia lanceoleosa]|nr:Transportin MOS14 [Camellia lanceoleosa]